MLRTLQGSASVIVHPQLSSDLRGSLTFLSMRQVLDNRYIEHEDLHALLKRLFGAGKYEVEVGDVSSFSSEFQAKQQTIL